MRMFLGSALVLATAALAGSPSQAQLADLSSMMEESKEEERKLGWSNSTDLSFVVTEGNSSTETFGLKNTLWYRWPKAGFRLRFDGLRSNTADDRFAVVDTGSVRGFRVIEPAKEPDVERFLAELRYDRKIRQRLAWVLGVSWDRNEDAGIENRFIGFAGVAHQWWEREDLKFQSGYGLGYTDREEEFDDPLKDEQFPTAHLFWHYLNKFGKVTTFTNDWTTDVNVSDTADFSADMTTAVAASLSERLELKVSVQGLWNNKPALEDLALFEFDENGNPILVGDVQVRRERLDLVFRTSLVVNF